MPLAAPRNCTTIIFCAQCFYLLFHSPVISILIHVIPLYHVAAPPVQRPSLGLLVGRSAGTSTWGWAVSISISGNFIMWWSCSIKLLDCHGSTLYVSESQPSQVISLRRLEHSIFRPIPNCLQCYLFIRVMLVVHKNE